MDSPKYFDEPDGPNDITVLKPNGANSKTLDPKKCPSTPPPMDIECGKTLTLPPTKCQKFYQGVKPLKVYIFLVFYCVFGAFAFYEIEKALDGNWNMDPRVQGERQRCLGAHSYWAALFYVFTVCSTIGFGNLYPCTVPTKALTVVYSIIGIPLVIMILTDLGKRNCQLMVVLHRAIMRQYHRHRFRHKDPFPTLDYIDAIEPTDVIVPKSSTTAVKFYRTPSIKRLSTMRRKNKPTGNFSTRTRSAIGIQDNTPPPDLPMSFGFLLIFVCLMVTSLYIKITEPNLPFDIAIYYSFLFFLAGDYMTERYHLAIPTYLLLFFGFATVSTTISIVMYNIDNFMNRVKREINEEIKHRIDEAMENVTSGSGEEKKEEPNAEAIVNQAMRKYATAWYLTIPAGRFHELVDFTETEVDFAKEEISLYREQAQLEEEQRRLGDERLPTVDRGMQTYPLLIDRKVGDTLITEDECEQFPFPPIQVEDKQSGPNYKRRFRSAGVWARPQKLDAWNQIKPIMCSKADNTERAVKVDRSQQIMPKKRTVKTQYPRVDDELNRSKTLPQIGWLVEVKSEQPSTSSTPTTPPVERRGQLYKAEYY